MAARAAILGALRARDKNATSLETAIYAIPAGQPTPGGRSGPGRPLPAPRRRRPGGPGPPGSGAGPWHGAGRARRRLGRSCAGGGRSRHPPGRSSPLWELAGSGPCGRPVPVGPSSRRRAPARTRRVAPGPRSAGRRRAADRAARAGTDALRPRRRRPCRLPGDGGGARPRCGPRRQIAPAGRQDLRSTAAAGTRSPDTHWSARPGPWTRACPPRARPGAYPAARTGRPPPDAAPPACPPR
jgi:hypothetical protein